MPGNGRPKVMLELGKPATLRLLYADPQTGEGQYGRWWRYTVEQDGEERSFFCPASVQALLEKVGVNVGDELTLTQQAEKRSGKLLTRYDVALNGQPLSHGNGDGGSEGSGRTETTTTAQPPAEETPSAKPNGSGYRATWKSEEAQAERCELLARLCDGEEWQELLTKFGKLYTASLLTSLSAWMETGTGFQPQQVGASATTMFLRVVESLETAKAAHPREEVTQPQPAQETADAAPVVLDVTTPEGLRQAFAAFGEGVRAVVVPRLEEARDGKAVRWWNDALTRLSARMGDVG